VKAFTDYGHGTMGTELAKFVLTVPITVVKIQYLPTLPKVYTKFSFCGKFSLVEMGLKR
jgi:hypothetical protein